jgi:DNA replication and repair protein RecF
VRITKLRLFQYRNIKELEIVPSAGANLFFGLNGQGKTNLLESIYLLAYGKSFRTANPKDCIQHGCQEGRIEGAIEHGSLNRDLRVSITRSEKKLFLLGKPAAIEQFVGNLHLLAFTHEHLNVVRGAPSDRRAFLDRAMVSLYPGHIRYLAAYGRALKQRNSILSSEREGREIADQNLLDSWDEALVKPGAHILWNRLRYVKQMKEELPQGLFGAETLKMHYFSTVDASPAMAGAPAAAGDASDFSGIEDQFRRHLRNARANDRRTGYTSVGPHRDDLKLYVNGKSLVDFGSAGQQRSGLLTLYFSQMEIHRKIHNFYPVFLVDDAEAELDEQRLNAFLKYLSQRTQTFFTSAKKFLLASMPESTSHFEMQNGTIFSSSAVHGPVD